MKIFLDTIDLKEINKYNNIFEITGITTNPNLARRFGMSDDIEMVKQISKVIGKAKEIHVEAFGDTSEEIIQNSIRIKNKCQKENLVFKIPFSEAGVSAAKFLKSKKFKINLHLIFSLGQAIIASSIKSDYICPLIGRLDDIGHDAIKNITAIKNAYEKNKSITAIMGSSIRNLSHVLACYRSGIDVITIPMKVVKEMFQHPLTDVGFTQFKKDLNEMKLISTVNFNKNLIINADDTLLNTLVTLQKYKGAAIAVCKNNKLRGIFTTGDLNRLIESKKKFSYEDKIEKFISTNPFSVDISDHVEVITNLVKKKNLGQFVVVDQEKVLGILDVKDLI